MDEMIEKRKAATVLIAAVIVSLALGVGLAKVGSGFATRSSDGIIVIGSAKVDAKADKAVWTLSIQNNGRTPASAVTGIDSGISAVQKYLIDGGIKSDQLTLGAISLSQNIGSVLQEGVNVSNYGPQYYVSTLSKIRPALLSDATKDAKARAEAMTKAVGGKVGAITSVKSGPIQVTTPDSTMTSDMGMYDTSSIKKTVTATVTVTFKTE